MSAFAVAMLVGSPPALAYNFGGSAKQVGSETTVFDYADETGALKNACDVNDTPDGPTPAFRDSSNRVELVIPDGGANRSLLSPPGGTLTDVAPETRDSCQNRPAILTAAQNGDPSHFQDNEFLYGTYSFPGLNPPAVYALIHDEYHGRNHPEADSLGQGAGCPGYDVTWEGKCNFVAITSAKWQATDPSGPQNVVLRHSPVFDDNLVASIPCKYDRNWGDSHGLAGPNNIVYNAQDDYFYTLAFPRPGPTFCSQPPAANCLLRSPSLGSPPPWQAFAGFDTNGQPIWNQLTNPYTFDYTNDPQANHVCKPLGQSRQNTGNRLMQLTPRSLTWNNYVGKWMLVGSGPGGVRYTLSDNLLDWSRTKLLMSSPSVADYACNPMLEKPVSYPVLLDASEPQSTHTGTSNFETAGQTPYLFVTRVASYTRNRTPAPGEPCTNADLSPTNDRDVVRFKVDFSQKLRNTDFEPTPTDPTPAEPYGFDAVSTTNGSITRGMANPPNSGTVGQNVGTFQLNAPSTCTIVLPCGASGDDDVLWRNGDAIGYGAWVYLPSNFYSQQQADIGLLQWDNAGTMPLGSTFDYGGIVIGSDHQTRLVRGRSDGTQDTIGAPFSLPTGAWVRVWVVQLFSTTGTGAVNYVSWQRAGETQTNWVLANVKQPNAYGRLIDRLRFGIVANGNQQNPLSLQLDCAGINQANC